VIILPAIDLHHGRCVRLRQGRAEEETVYDEDPAKVARRWVAAGAEWLHVVNLDGAFGVEKSVNLQRLAELRAAVPDTPIQFGGGIRSVEDVARALELGATRAVLGTAAVRDPEMVSEAVARFGAERIVVGIDARDGQVAVQGWQVAGGVTALELGCEMRRRGVVRAVYTDIKRDGMLTGVNVEATAALARATGLLVIASGGVASLDDIRRVRAEPEIEGAIVGQALYTGAVSLREAIQAAAEAEV
jgi:phosphoribosylformimino-5-aminoimidazole carboxamide ribotide isomerase